MMNDKQALYFIGKCLTLTQFPERKKEVVQLIEAGKVNWEKLVRVSSGHMVLPALYLNLKRANLLTYLPKDLVDYFSEITQLNRERNLAIIKQAKNINALLIKNNINPIFLKGTAHLLENLYLDIGERMIGDIDFLVDPKKVDQVIEIFKDQNYNTHVKYYKEELNALKHYPRLVHKDKIAAIEIHWAIVNPPHKNNLDYNTIVKTKLFTNDIFVPSYGIQTLHNILNTQVNDKGFLYGRIMLRQLYDGYLLSFKPNVMDAYKNYAYNFYLKNLYLRLIQNIFNTKHLIFDKSFLSNILMLRYNLRINMPKINNFIKIIILFILRIYNYSKAILQAFYKKEVRTQIYIRLIDPAWYGRLIRFYKE